MISLDQVLLLQQKVESAVAKIAELNQAVAQKEAENAALRSKCVELTNALSAKTEQFSSFQSDQSKIEEGILKALERLNAVESTVLSVANAASQVNQAAQMAKPVQTASVQNAAPASNAGTAAQQEAAPLPHETAMEEPEPPVSPDMTVEEAQAMSAPETIGAESQSPVAAEESSFSEGSIDPDITFDDAAPSPEQPNGSQGQFDIF